ncbi:TIGR00266 family protein [Aporhodopirellula aestuarii]|uniref:TIGR00266 family protein n=1 Tax=Aporhodopirellula aestuarii TaxID=2950107 RepID=A0ABT0U4K6_9BACT|nr:TIGR00266 family protein [Aporhodopirellula aestuarii]MCM2371818.1 TIGR00266 family protein [Aporhodopirellula aestuarii]
MIEIACPSCQKRYRLDDKFAGKKAKCKQCGAVLLIKAPVDDVAGSPPASPAKPVAPAKPAPTQASPAPPSPPRPAAPAGSAQRPPTPAPRAASPPVAEAIPTVTAEPIIEAVVVEPQVVEVAEVVEPFAGTPGPRSGPGASQNGAAETLRGTTSHMQYEISQRPDFSIVKIHLPQGGKVYAEPSAMVSMTPSMHLEAGFKGGLGKTFGRLLGGESLIINTFTAQDGPGEVMFAGGAAGDVAYHRLNGNSLYLQRGAYMFNSEGVEVSGKWQGAKGFFSGEGLVLLKATGTGDIFFNSYGAIIPIDVTEGFMVDTGYIVAFEESLQYRVTVLPGLRTAGKIKSFFFGGEGLVCQFAGSGRVWIQTRQVKSFLAWVNAFRPTKSN